MNVKKVIIILIFLTIFFTEGFTQVTSTYNFLRLDVDAKSSAMAGTYVAAINDVNTIFYNPAGLATLKSNQASVGFFKYLMDINSGNASISKKYKDIGYFGVGIRFINYGSFDKYDEFDNNLGTFSATDIALSLGYANKYNPYDFVTDDSLTKDISLNYGINLKFIYSHIDEYNSSALSLDAGLIYHIPKYMVSVGASILNAGFQLDPYYNTKENLPIDLRIGVSKQLEDIPLTVNLSFSNLLEKQDKFFKRFRNVSIGGDFQIYDYVHLRLGYNNQQRQDLKTGSTIGLAGFSAGFGFVYEDKYILDYSYNSMGKIGSTHRINVAVRMLDF